MGCPLISRLTHKPEHIFGRDADWDALVSFVTDPRPVATLGVVSGRRRQGKTFLLNALAHAAGGFYFEGVEGTETELLRMFGAALAEHTGSPAGYSFAGWDEALGFLLEMPGDRPIPLVLDEFPFLMKASPSLPSLVQREIDKRSPARQGSGAARLLLCGSPAVRKSGSVMGGLLAGAAPLRGRAGLEMLIHPLDYREAARFWDAADPRLAVLLHAVVGGTPAYRREFVRDDVPDGLADFDDWVVRTVLNPRSPLFREARYLLAVDAGIRDRAVYHSVLAAVANGNTTWGGIAGYIGRKSPEIAHPISVLEDCRLLEREQDPFRSSRSQYRITEPLIAFHQAVMRPTWAELELGGGARVWPRAQARFLSQVVGPHFESLCRQYALRYGQEAFGTQPGDVAAGTVADPANRSQIQVDVVALGPAWPGERRAVVSLGEAKWDKVMGVRHLHRLRRARDLLAVKGLETEGTVLACYSGAGFDADLREAARRERVRLVDLNMLYGH